MLGDAHRPQQADAAGAADHLRGFDQLILGHAGQVFGHLQGERRQRFAVGVHVVDLLGEEFLVGEAVVEDVARQRGDQREVGTRPVAQIDVGAFRHFMLARIDHQQLLAAQLVRALDLGGDHRMVLGDIAADQDDQIGAFDVLDRAGVSAVTDGAEQALGRRVLTVARGIVDAVGADDQARDLLRQIGFLVAGLARSDEADAVGAVRVADVEQAPRDEIQRLVPGRFAKTGAIRTRLADQRPCQALLAVDEVPGKAALHTGRNAIGGRVDRRLHAQQMPVARPHLERTADAAIGAHRFGFLDLRLSQLHIHFRQCGDRRRTDRFLQRLDEVDHRSLEALRHRGERSGVRLHRFFEQGVARTDRHAVPALDAARLADRLAAVPEHAWVGRGIVDAQRFVDLDILAGLDALSAQNALVGVVGIERTGRILFVGLARIRIALDRNIHVGEGVVQLAVAGVVLAGGAVQLVLGEQAVHAFFACSPARIVEAGDLHAVVRRRRTTAFELSVDFDPAGVAGLQRAECLVIADLRHIHPIRVHQFDEQLAGFTLQRPTVEFDRAACWVFHDDFLGNPWLSDGRPGFRSTLVVETEM